MKKRRAITLLLAIVLIVGFVSISEIKSQAKTRVSYAIGTAIMDCSVWTKPDSRNAANKVKVVQTGNQVTVDVANIITGSDGKRYYKTKKNAYIMTKCLAFPTSFENVENIEIYASSRNGCYGDQKNCCRLNLDYNREDKYGNVFSSAFQGYACDADGGQGAIFELNGEYTSFSCILSVSKSSKQSDKTGKVHIYVDDLLVYCDDNITKNTKATPISIDLTGAQTIKIWMVGNGNGAILSQGLCTVLGNPTLYKVNY